MFLEKGEVSHPCSASNFAYFVHDPLMMKYSQFFPAAVVFIALLFSCEDGNEQETESEVSKAAFLPVDSTYANPYRPQFHFSPRSQWMNDP
ncbi:MAG: hypothetical protein AAGA85_15680, partial [Bacteroidota bacterium]